MIKLIKFVLTLLILGVVIYVAVSVAAIIFFLIIPIALLLIAKNRNKGNLRLLPDHKGRGVRFKFKTNW